MIDDYYNTYYTDFWAIIQPRNTSTLSKNFERLT